MRKDVDPDEVATFVIAAYEGYISLAKNAQHPAPLQAGQKTLARYLASLRAKRDGRRIAA